MKTINVHFFLLYTWHSIIAAAIVYSTHKLSITLLKLSIHYLAKQKSTKVKSHEVIRNEKLKNCSFCPIRTRLYCKTCCYHVCQACLPKNNH